MRRATPGEVKQMIQEFTARNDSLNVTRLTSAMGHYIDTLEDQGTFLSLVWQDSPRQRLLTPAGQPRTLKDVAERFLNAKYTYTKLATPLGLPSNLHDPTWFEKCVTIDNQFSMSKFGRLLVSRPIDDEEKQSKEGTFYIHDGVHRSLVLATRLMSGQTKYTPVEIMFVVPRPPE